MYYPQTPIEVWGFLAFLAAGFAAIFYALGLIAWKAIDKGRTWKITVPEVPGQLATIERVRPSRGTVTRPAPSGKGEKETQILAPPASYPTNRGPLQLLTSYGANLIAPSKDDKTALLYPAQPVEGPHAAKTTAEWRDLVFARFRIWDPLIYWRATRENDMEDFYAAQQDKQHWMVQLAPFALLAVGALSLMMVFVLWKVLPLLNGAGA